MTRSIEQSVDRTAVDSERSIQQTAAGGAFDDQDEANDPEADRGEDRDADRPDRDGDREDGDGDSRDDAGERVDPADVTLHTRYGGSSAINIPRTGRGPTGGATPLPLIASRAIREVMTAIRVLSYNVRYANRGDHHDAWHDRRDAVARLVRFHRPDIAAFQEPLPEQRRDLRERLPKYEFVGRGREANGEGEGCPIAVRSDRWEAVEDGTFWLSETPDEPSTGWDAAYPRIVTWARVRTVDGTEELLVVNTHFDHVSAHARRESARLLRERVPEIAAADEDDSDETPPVVLVGDLNCTPGSEPHRILVEGDGSGIGDEGAGKPSGDALALRDAAAEADLRHGPETSLTDFARLIDGRRIDHALVSPAVSVDAFATLADRDDRGRYPSDHLPILARLSI